MFEWLPAILSLFFDVFIILWTQYVNHKGKQRFVLFSDHFVFYYCTLSLFQYSCRKQTKFERDLILIVTLNTLFCFYTVIFNCWYLTNFSTHFCDRLQLWKKLRQLKLNALNFKVTYLSPICQHCLLLMNIQAGWNWNQSGIWYSYPLLLSGICILGWELFITPKYQSSIKFCMNNVSSFFVWTM